MFTKLNNIDTAFRQLRAVMMIVIIACFFLLAIGFVLGYRLISRTQDRIYVLAGGQALQAFSSKIQDNIPVEARNHVRNFHQCFFTLDPDETAIAKNLERALYLADNSAKRAYDDLYENGFYSSIISGNVNQTIEIDSVQLETDYYPIKFRCYASQEVVRPKSITRRKLITEGALRRISRSDHNPHGFLIERWKILLHQDIATQARN